MMKEINCIDLIKDRIKLHLFFDEKNISLVIQVKTNNSYSLFPYRQPVALWRQL